MSVIKQKGLERSWSLNELYEAILYSYIENLIYARYTFYNNFYYFGRT